MNNANQTEIAELTILIPAWNELDCISGVLREFEEAPALSSIRLIVIDDDSTDGTGTVLDEYSHARPGVNALHVPHGGKDRALWTGFAAVCTGWTGMMDADGQYDPADFPRLMAHAAETSSDAVWGVRTRRQDDALRFVSSRIGRLAKRIALGGRTVRDTGCGIWVARTKYLQPVPGACAGPAGQVHCHIPEMITVQGGCVAELDITHRSRHGGKAKFAALNRIIPGLRSLRQAASAMKRLRG